MRRELSKSEGDRKKFSAVFSRLGKRMGYQGYTEETLLLTDVVDLETNTKVTDHVWFAYTKGFQAVVLTEGVLLEFEARVKKYSKGYANRSLRINHKKVDFKLSNPTKIRLLKIVKT